MNTTIPTLKDEQCGLGLRFWLFWGAGFALTHIVFLSCLFWLRFHRDWPWNTSGIMFAAVAYALACAGMCFLPLRTQQKRGLEGPMRPAMRRYTWRFLAAMVAYVVVLTLSLVYAKTYHPTGAVALRLALVCALPMLLAIRALMLLPREENDEYMHARIRESYVIATGGALAICSVWGFLQTFKLLPEVPLWTVFPIWCACLGPANIYLHRRCS